MTSPSLKTLPAVLSMRAAATPDRLVYRFLRDGDMQAQELSYAALWRRANTVASTLRARTGQGARVLVMCPPGLDFIAGLWGALIAERVAVPTPPPRFERSASRFELLLADTMAGAALVTAPMLKSLGSRESLGLDLIAVDTLNEDARSIALGLVEGASGNTVAREDDLAILQYTSGSTAHPRGVMLSHAKLMENCLRSAEAAQIDASSHMVSWLPPYHDMGLVACILGAVVIDFPSTMMSPATFMSQPRRWLEAITRYRGTHSGAPNFVFDLCARRVTSERKAELDLSSWRVAWNGAERVRPETIDAFCTAFGRVGFQRQAMRPCYGLAEATLTVAMAGTGPVSFAASTRELGRHHVAVAESLSDTTLLSSSGTVIPKTTLAIVDPITRQEQPSGLLGEIWLEGPSVASGYFQRVEESERTFRGQLASEEEPRWLRTGDQGFLRNDQLFVTGRLKDLLLIRGRHFYPDDLETTAQSAHPALRPHCGAAFSVEVDGEERVCLVQEVDPSNDLRWDEVASLVRAAVFAEHDLVLYDLWLVRPGQVPRTSSGKVQHAFAQRRYLEGEFETILRQSATRAPTRRSRHEDLVARACAEALGLPEVDRDEDLFKLGLHSLSAMRLIGRLEQVLSIQLSVRTAFEARTVARLSRMLESARPRAPEQAIEPQQADLFPLSPTQACLWNEHIQDTTSSAHNLAVALTVRGPCSPERLDQAWQQLVARHAILHTRYRQTDLGATQEVSKSFPQETALLDVHDMSEAQRAAQHLASIPFDLRRDPAVRSAILRVSPDHHWLVLVFHRIALDGDSLRTLLAEFKELLVSEVRGSAPALPPVRVGYPDYAHWHDVLTNEVETNRLAVREDNTSSVRTKLPSEAALCTFPPDTMRPSCRSLEALRVTHTLPAPLLHALDAFCQEFGVTRYMALLAICKVLLMRSSGSSDLCVGTKASKRPAQAEGVLGTFVSTSLMQTQVTPNLTFVQLVAQVRATVLESFEHRASSHVVEASTPLPPVAFDYLSLRDFERHAEHFDLDVISFSSAMCEHDARFLVLEVANELQIHLDYRLDLYEAESAQGLLKRFALLLESVLLEPHARCGHLPWLLPKEHEARLSLGRGPTRGDGGNETFVDAFEAWVSRTPDQTAVSSGHERLSYRALDARANQLAHVLRQAGVGPDVTVAVCLGRHVELLVALLAVVKAGGTFVPLDPSYPDARLALMLEDADPRVILTEEGRAADLPTWDGSVCVLKRGRARVEVLGSAHEQDLNAMSADAPPRGSLGPQNLAYVLFTSGSSGRPKGVAISHGSLRNLLASMAREPGLDASDLLLAITTISFDIALVELFLPLVLGAQVEIACESVVQAPRLLVERLARGDVTCLQSTPTTFSKLLEAGLSPQANLKLLCGGEVLRLDLARALARCAGRGLYHLYGPTETTIWSTCNRVDPEARELEIGGAIDNTFLYVLDQDGMPVPAGVAGELFIGGAGVARGYHRRTDLSSEHFLKDPFQTRSSAYDTRSSMYRTGDAARFRRDGKLEFLGRLDQQVKVRGMRVELGEIESQLLCLPGVDASVVALFEAPSQATMLIAYVVKTPGSNLSSWDMQAALRVHLPEFMLPEVYVELPALPLLPNGKVDRGALLLPREASPKAPGKHHDAPRNELEQFLCTLFEEVLERKPVGLTDRFFDLGGDSTLAVVLFERLAAHTGRRLPLATLFEAETPLDLSLVVRANEGSTASPIESYLVPLSENGQAPQLYCVHPDGTGPESALDWYRPLLNRLGVAAWAVTCEEDAYLELDQIAERHVRAICRTPLPRSVTLMGVGLGGNIAQAMAHKLEAIGVHVAHVIVVQSSLPQRNQSLTTTYFKALGANLRRAVGHFSELLPHQRTTRKLVFKERAQSWWWRTVTRQSPQLAPELEDLADLSTVPACYRSLSAPQWNALLRHQTAPCRAAISVIRGHRRGLKPLDEAQGFGTLSLSTVEAHILDGSPEQILDHEVAPAFASVLRDILAGCASDAPTWPLTYA